MRNADNNGPARQKNLEMGDAIAWGAGEGKGVRNCPLGQNIKGVGRGKKERVSTAVV